ncbi:MAG: glycosyltransferase family 2 protein [Desulfovibrionaceae bacterium]
MDSLLDIIIPVYNEGDNIRRTLDALFTSNRTPFVVHIVYDFDEDNTLPAVAAWRTDNPAHAARIRLLRNEGRMAHGAVMTGFDRTTAPAVLMFPADDDFNLGIVDRLHARFADDGCDIVCASRFIPGGCMKGCPWLKAVLVRCAAFTLHHVARIPTHDASNGFRLFSRRVLDTIPVESSEGFTYSIELLVKAHERGLRIGEVPARWYERSRGSSRFRVLKWLPAYLRWYVYGMRVAYRRLIGGGRRVAR